MIKFQSLENINLEILTECFNLAFSDYAQPINFTVESLKYYLNASTVDLALSYGAFDKDELVGFILNSTGIYKNNKVVFDAGTGVVPNYRGQKVFSSLFEYACGELLKHEINHYYLEVLQSNDHAISIYRKNGFEVERGFSVLVGTGSKKTSSNQVGEVLYESFQPFDTKYKVEPSYEHTTENISQNPHLYEVMYIQDKAYCIYAKRNGEIIQLHYNELDALKEIMKVVLSRYPKSMAKNIDENNKDVIKMLEEVGYREFMRQYEMVKVIK